MPDIISSSLELKNPGYQIKNGYKVYQQYIMWSDAMKEGKFNSDLLVDLKRQVGEKRFDSQYFRVNLDPTDL